MLLVSDLDASQRLPVAEPAAQGLDKLKQVRSKLPAVTHVDGSARIQTVHREDNPGFHAVIEHFFQKTGCPVIVNTSFNVRGEPIVCTPEDAISTFRRSGLQHLALNGHLLSKQAD